jgi:nicotinamide mononucleotide transporter
MNYQKTKRLLGTKSEHIEQIKVAAMMLIAAAAYVFVSKHVVPDYTFNVFEFIGTWTGLVCVWLSRTRNILCWPWGIVSSAALGVFFSQIGLPGQQWLNWGYFLIIQLWAWPHWVFGGKENDDLPVTIQSGRARVVTLLILILGTIGIYSLIDIFVPGSLYPWLDALVVSASVIAQYLLGRKKVESWVLWLGPVNMVSIALFFLAGAYTLTAMDYVSASHKEFAKILKIIRNLYLKKPVGYDISMEELKGFLDFAEMQTDRYLTLHRLSK